MKMKILSIFVVGILFFSTVNVIGFTLDDDSNIKIAEEKNHISFSQATIETKGEYISVNIEEANTFLRATGKPLLPVYTKTFTFPRGTKIKNVECIISDVTSEIIDGKIQPSPRPKPRISLKNSIQQNNIEEIINNQEKTIEDASVYSSSDLFPDRWFNYKIGCGLYKGEDTIFVKVDCFPIRYSPAENTLYYINTFDIYITYEEVLKKAPSNASYDLLIITPQKFRLFLLSLSIHKIKMGIQTKIITVESIYKEYTTGRDKPEKIKYCIKDAKEKWGITYVLLFGGLKSNINADDKDNTNEGSTDWNVPVRYVNTNYEWGESSHISDLYYSDLYNGEGEFEDWDSNGNGIFGDSNDDMDLYPDVYYGRLPCTTILEVITIIKKIIRYERPSILGKPWLNKMIVAGGMTTESWYEGQPDGEWLCDKSIEYMGGLIKSPVRIYASNNETNGDPRPVPRDMTKEFSKGAGFAIIEGHGNTLMWDTHWPNTDGNWTGGITNYDIPFIFNYKKLPIVVVGGCHNGLFNVSLVKAINDDPGYDSMYHTYGLPVKICFSWKLCTKIGGGAIASTGCTAFGLGSTPPDSYSGGLESYFFYEIGQNNAKTLGAAHSGSITKYINETYIENDDVYVITQYQLFGDPSLRIGGY